MSSVYGQCYWPMYESKYFWHWNKACLLHIVKQNLLWLDFKTFWRRAWRGFVVTQPFGCKSHWSASKEKTFEYNGEMHKRSFPRTWYRPKWWYEFTIGVCDWLENKARQAEEREEKIVEEKTCVPINDHV